MVYDREHYLLKQKHEMNQTQPQEDLAALEQHQGQEINPAEYIATVINLYREDEGDYRGRRNEDQEIVAELASEEADEYFDASLQSIWDLAKLGSADMHSTEVKPSEAAEADITLGGIKDGVSLREMRNAWRQLWVGMSILTNRLHRDSEGFRSSGYPELFHMDSSDKSKVLGQLFANFQDLNALRFGAEGSGVKRNRYIPDLDGAEPTKVRVDADKAIRISQDSTHSQQLDYKVVAQNAARRRYTVQRDKDSEAGAVHPAGKMSPEEFTALRRLYPEVDMNQFARDAAFLKDIAKYYQDHDED
jgi:hypothetical protein